MKTIKQNLYFLNLSISSKKQNLVIKSFLILFLFFISICPTLFSQDFSNQLNDDSVVVKADYRNHINIPEYDPSLMPLNRQTSSTGVWTELNPKVPRVDYLGIHFVNKDTGWACGANGTIIKTIDGGNSWTNSISNTTTPILKVRSYNGQIVIASGYGGTILRSTDGGELFVQVTSNVAGDLWGLQMINDTLGWACGISNSLTKTTDGGQTWQRILTPGYTTSYWWIDFMNENYCFIAADGKALRTTDGGNNWEIIQAGDAYPLFCIDIIDSLHIAAAGYGGFNYAAKNLYSSDGGNNWIAGDTLTTEAVNCIQYINPDTGYLVMDEHYYGKTTNRGQVWDYIYNPEMGEFEFHFLLNNNLGYSAGTGLSIYKTQSSYENWQPTIINDNFSDVCFTNENKGFAISSFGYSYPFGLYKTEDAGINWEKVSGAPYGTTLLFLDSLTGFIGTDQIYKTTDGGLNWYIPNGGQGGAGKIFFINETTGWAIRSNIIYKTTDRGENWFTQFTAPSSIGFNSIYFVDSLYGWTANSNGRPYKTTDGGNNWHQQTGVNIGQSIDVLFKDYLNGFLLESNKLYKTNNGGTTFNLIPEVTGYSVAGKFRNYEDSTIFIIGYRTFRSLDAGNTWADFPELTGTKITGLSLLSKGYGYASGELGLIMKYNDTSIPVELTFFTSSMNENDVTLNWQTATETNNLGFQIERQKMQGERSDNWNCIGFVNGSGTTAELQSYSFIDKNLSAGKYQYRLEQIDYDGTFEYSNIVEVEVRIPFEFFLSQNYPNPFNPATQINYSIKETGLVQLKVYDILGKEILTLVNTNKEAGNYFVSFDASQLPSGVYFYKMQSGNFISTKKMIVIK